MSSARLLTLDEARPALCYPKPEAPGCDDTIAELERLGVEAVVDRGRLEVAGVRVLGKGWASVVVYAVWRGRRVAVKVLRQDARRSSLLWEAAAWSVASSLGIAPKLYAFGRRALVTEAVLGPRLDEYRPSNCWEAWLVLRRLLVKAWLLDVAGLLHNELARPGGQVLLDGTEPYIVDYESATPMRRGSRRTNLAQLVGGLKRYRWALKAAPGLAGGRITELLRSYKEGRRDHGALEEVVEALGVPSRRDCV